MAITKKLKVSFDVTVKMGTEHERKVEASIIELIKAVGRNEVEPDGVQKELIVQFLSEGMDGALAFAARKMLREGVKDMETEFDEFNFAFSPAKVEVTR